MINSDYRSVTIADNKKIQTSEAINGKISSRTLGGQKWTFIIEYPPKTRSDYKVLIAELTKPVFNFKIPEVEESITMSGVVSVGTHDAGSSTVTVTSSGTIKAGDYFQFEHHDKLYMALNTLGGDGTLEIYPPLVESVSLEKIRYNNIVLTGRNSNTLQYTVNTSNLSALTLEIIEDY